MTMAEQAQERVQTGIKNFVNDVDKSHLRPMEKKMHLCAADCCSDPKASIDEVHRCVERCQVGTKKFCLKQIHNQTTIIIGDVGNTESDTLCLSHPYAQLTHFGGSDFGLSF